jgi:hypothetical protein
MEFDIGDLETRKIAENSSKSLRVTIAAAYTLQRYLGIYFVSSNKREAGRITRGQVPVLAE